MLGVSVRTIQYRLHEYNAAPRSDVEVANRKPGRAGDEPPPPVVPPHRE